MATDDALLLVPENGAALFRLDSAGIRRLPIRGAHARLSDAALLPGGRVIAVERRFGWRGFLNALLVLQPDRRGFTISRRVPLRLSPLDNVEAVAVEPLPGGGRRLWLATDDNGQRPLRTLLLALEAPANWLEGA